jgi:fumarate reductase flavoprotein subunit
MTQSENFDVVVVGGGIAGLTAANRAAQLGLRAIVLEKGSGPQYLCNSRFSGGILHIAFHNIREGDAALSSVIDEATSGYAQPALREAFAKSAPLAVDWLRGEGAKFIRVAQSVWQQWVFAPPRALAPGIDWKGRGPDLTLRTLVDNLKKRGASIRLETRVTGLVQENGRCTGVDAETGGATVRYSASRAVVIADGGFQSNLDLVRENISHQPEKLKQRGAATGMGDGLRMARAIGAGAVGLDCFYGHLLSRDAFTNDKVWPYPQLDELGVAGILVDSAGQRFADEGKGGVYLANMVARSTDPLACCAIFDEAIWDGPGRGARIPANPNLIKAGGTVHKAESLAALADIIAMPAQALQMTIEKYNAALQTNATGNLDVPRSIRPNTAYAIVKPPFYAVPICAGITYTMGGLAIDADARVLRDDGSVIAGLYAAGAATGGLEGGPEIGYLGGLMKATTFGLRAAEHIKNRIED